MELLDIKCKYFLACGWCEKWNEICHAAQKIREDQEREQRNQHLTINKNISSTISNEYQGWDTFDRASVYATACSSHAEGILSTAKGIELEHDIPSFLTTKVDF